MVIANKLGIWVISATILSLCLFGGASKAFAAKIKFDEKKSMIKEISFKGDIRLRQQTTDREMGAADRQRQRFRLRFAVDVKLPHNLKVKTRFASGGGPQTSTNQTLDNNGSQKTIGIDRAYVQWMPFSILNLQGGRMKNPFWTVYSSDILWDTDYNPEGISQSVEGLVGPVNLFANLGQFSIQELSGSQKDVYALISQAGAEVKLPGQLRLKSAIAYHDWQNASVQALGGPVSPGTNTTNANGSRTHSFKIVELTGELSGYVGSLPVALQGTWVQNRGYSETVQTTLNPGQDNQNDGIQAGIIIGKAKSKNQWEVATFYKEVKSDAVIDEVADADFGAAGGSNLKGQVSWIAFRPSDIVKLQVKNFNSKRIIHTGNRDRVIKTQFDLIVSFK